MGHNGEPDTNPYIYGQVLLTREPRICNGENMLSSINDIGRTGKPHAKECNMPLTKMNLKWIKDFTIRLQTIKILEGRIGEELLTLVLSIFCFLCETKSTSNKSENQ